jgi:hypothetical protein
VRCAWVDLSSVDTCSMNDAEAEAIVASDPEAGDRFTLVGTEAGTVITFEQYKSMTDIYGYVTGQVVK